MKHTDGAVRAAKELWEPLRRVYVAAKCEIPENMEDNIAAIINQETGLPEITAERDRLREALVDCEKVMNISANQLATPVGSSGQTVLNRQLVECVIRTRAALAKEPESGETNQKGEPK